MSIVLGVIADDFTGATDVASILAAQGMRVVQVNGLPDENAGPVDGDAVVVALKTRTAPPEEAVAQSLGALAWLRGLGAEQYLFKYCSTFDSTPAGNIGPVLDALSVALGGSIAIVCPAFPDNGRRVYRGHLFVGDQLLEHSPMKDHPLTPMRQSSLVHLLEAQSGRRVGMIPLEKVRQGPEVLRAELHRLTGDGVAYAVADAVDNDDLRIWAKVVAGHPLISGGSAIALGLPDNYRQANRIAAASAPAPISGTGRAVILAGSCSAATRRQLARAGELWPSFQVTPQAVMTGVDAVAEALDWVSRQPTDHPVVIYTSADPDAVAAAHARFGREAVSAALEHALSSIAVALRQRGAGRFLVAGGETSGAVVSALGVRAMRIGVQIAPGVPWTESVEPNPIALTLKSGNFGGVDFFERALEALA